MKLQFLRLSLFQSFITHGKIVLLKYSFLQRKAVKESGCIKDNLTRRMIQKQDIYFLTSYISVGFFQTFEDSIK